jgi:signal transduction histidine kinase
VTIRCTPDKRTRRIKFTCQDRGIGIPADDQKQLFNRFYRASNATHQLIPGTGLGLSIVKKIVHDHGGEVRLTSVEGEGTTVVIDLPMTTQDSP